MSAKRITIAIDGYSSCGKSTLAKALAKELDYIFIDTGAMYRSVSLFCLRNNLVHNNEINVKEVINALPNIDIHFDKNPESGKLEVQLNKEFVEPYIRSMEVSQLVSKVASIKEVRAKLVEEQQKMGAKGGVVMDGRDIGTVVFPNAELKIFVKADSLVRAERRFKELQATQPTITMEEVAENLSHRDLIDSTREHSPLKQAEDALVLDNTHLNQEEQFTIALNWAKERIEA